MNTPDTVAARLRAGDIVLLRSGSPRMTITNVEDGIAWCAWFTCDTCHTHGFRLSALKKASNP